MNTKANRAVARGVKFLAHDQEVNGSFMCLASKKFDDYTVSEVVPAIVASTVVLSSLAHLPKTAPVLGNVESGESLSFL